jgi:HK97 family phage prohead protease
MGETATVLQRSFRLKGLKLDERSEGRFSGYASVFNVVDSFDSRILPGAFRKSLGDSPSRPLLLNHDPRLVVGVVRLQEDNHGLRAEGELNMDVERAREARSLMLQGALGGMSIGFIPRKWREGQDGVTEYGEVEVIEISLTPFPANKQARIDNVRSSNSKEDSMEISKKVEELQAQFEEVRSELVETRKQINAVDLRTQRGGGSWSSDGNDFATRMVRAIEEHRGAFSSAGRVRFSLPGPLEVRAVTRPATLPSSTSARIGEASTTPVSDLISLIPRAEINAPLVYIPRETNPSWTAAPQTEGAVKAVSTVELAGVQIPVITIASVLTASRQLLEDLAGVEAFVRSRLEYAILRTLETEILLGSGGSDHLTGLITMASTWSLPSPLSGNLWDLLRMAAAEVENRGFRPTVAVMNPQTALRVQLQKDAELRYLAAPNGIPPIVTSAEMATNSVLIADLSQVILRVKSDMVTDLSEHTGDNFTRNLVTFRTEMRCALAIYSPSAMVKFTLPS